MKKPLAREQPNTEQTKNISFLRILFKAFIATGIILLVYFISPFEIVRVSTDGMSPALPVGSVSVAIETNEETEYQVGDIISFSATYGGTYYSSLTHRIIAIDGDTVVTKADNTPENTSFTIHKSQIHNRIIIENIFKK